MTCGGKVSNECGREYHGPAEPHTEIFGRRGAGPADAADISLAAPGVVSQHPAEPRGSPRAPRRDPQDHLLHVRLPLRHRRPHGGDPRSPHRGQPRPPGQPRRALRQGRRRHHAAPLARPPAGAAAPRRPARLRRVPRDPLVRGARDRDELARAGAREAPRAPRLLHRPRPEPGADRLVGAAVRHPELRRARRLLLGQHGRRRHLHHGRRLLGVRRARLGAHRAAAALRRRRGPRLEPPEDQSREAQGPRRPHRLGQPGPHRLQRHRRPVDRHHPGHRRPPDPQPRPPAAVGRPRRPRLPAALDQRLAPRRPRSRVPGLRQRAAGRPRPRARLGSRAEARGAGRRAGAQAGALWRLQHRPDLRQAGVPAHRRDLPRPGARPGSGGTGLRPRARHDPPPRRRAGAGRLRARDHPRPPLDRLPRRAPRDDDRPAGGGARHARHLRPLERLPDLPRPAPLAAHPRHRRDPGRLPLRAALPEARRAAPEAAPQGHARLPARRPAAGLPARPGGPCPRRRRPAEAHRQGLHLGGAARCPRDAAHRDRQRGRAGSLPDRGAVPLHGQHGLELGDEHRRDHGDARPHRRFRGVRHPADHRRRQLFVRDRRLRRPRAPGHDLPRAPRLHQPARPPDLRARRRHQLDPLAGRRARSPGPRGRPRLPVGAARPRRTA